MEPGRELNPERELCSPRRTRPGMRRSQAPALLSGDRHRPEAAVELFRQPFADTLNAFASPKGFIVLIERDSGLAVLRLADAEREGRNRLFDLGECPLRLEAGTDC